MRAVRRPGEVTERDDRPPASEATRATPEHDAAMAIDLAALGLNRPGTVHHNLPAAVLIEHAVQRGEGKLAAHGALVAITGRYTGRSPDDKFIVRDDETAQTVWWGKVNKATDS